MGRQKNFENMTHEERCEYWEKKRAKETADRGALIQEMETQQPEMITAVKELKAIAYQIGTEMQYEGAEAIWVSDMHKLIERAERVGTLFNMGD
mgnify:FL=1|tara:strand:+ start:726 stop:1007 length:282 start_codon:yes stop_codon:yes gene_type:complete